MSHPKYRLTYKDRAISDVKKMDLVMRRRLSKSLVRFSQNPLAHGVKLKKSGVAGDYRFRVGNYRTLFDLEKDEIVILRIMHRREVYDR